MKDDYTVRIPRDASAAVINAAITAASAMYTQDGIKRTLRLEGDRYSCTVPIVGKNGVKLKGAGREKKTTLVAAFTGGADDINNYLVGAVGALSLATLNTTLTADAISGQSLISVANAGTIAPNNYMVMISRNDGGQSYPGDLGHSDGDDVRLRELVRVASNYAGGLGIPLAQPMQQNHAGPTKAGLLVQAVTPVTDFELEDLHLEGAGGGSITAVGFSAQYAMNVRVKNVSGSNFSKCIINGYGCKGIYLDGVHSYGTVNGWVHFESCITGCIKRCTGEDDVARVHTSGYPREQIYLRFRCVDIEVSDCHPTCGALGGIFHGGGTGLRFESCSVRNMKCTQDDYSRFLTSPEGGGMNGLFHALGFGSGNGPLNIAEFAQNTHIADIVIEADTFDTPTTAEWYVSGVPRVFAAYIHDTMTVQVNNFSILNKGRAYVFVGGARFSDCDGQCSNMTVVGTRLGWFGQNVGNSILMNNFRYNPIAGDAHAGGIAIYLDYTSNSSSGPQFKGVRSNSDFGAFLRYGNSWLASESSTPDVYFSISDLLNDNGRWGHCWLAYNATGTGFFSGDIVEIDPTFAGVGLPRIRTPVTADPNYRKRLVVVVTGGPSDDQTGPMLVCPLPESFASINCSAAVVERGDNLVYDEANPRKAKADNNASYSLGIARERKAAGAGIVRCSSGGIGSVDWTLRGNAGTNAANDYLGTTDATDVVLRRNAVERARLTADGVKVTGPVGKADPSSPDVLSVSTNDAATPLTIFIRPRGNATASARYGEFYCASDGVFRDLAFQHSGGETLRVRSDGVKVRGTSPIIMLEKHDAGVDYKKWWANVQPDVFKLQVVNDAEDAAADVFSVVRAGLTVSSFTMNADATRFPVGKRIELYNTADMVTNYEKGNIEWVGNALTIRTLGGGTGTNRRIDLFHADGSGIRVGGFANLAIVGSAAGQCSISTDDAVGLSLTSRITTGTTPGFLMQNGTFGTQYSLNGAGTQKHVRASAAVNQGSTAQFVGIEGDFNPVTVGSGGFYLMRLMRNAVEKFRVDGGEPAAGDTNLLLTYHNGGGVVSAQRVTVGAADSGGTGFKVLRVPN